MVVRALIGLDFALAVLAAFGLQALMDHSHERAVKWGFACLTTLAAIVVAAAWVHHTHLKLSALDSNVQARSFIWPVVGLGALAFGAVLFFLPPGGRWAAGHKRRLPSRPMVVASTLFAAEAVFLLTATAYIWSSSNTFFPATQAEATLQQEVGTNRVGFASCPSILAWPNLGIVPEANDLYGVSEIGAYDGTIPKTYFTAYFDYLHQSLPPGGTGFGQYCPSMTTAGVARHFGVAYVLADPLAPAPPGMKLTAEFAGEELYRVPGGGLITVEPKGAPQDSPKQPSRQRVRTTPTQCGVWSP